jgi:hypothetical protein
VEADVVCLLVQAPDGIGFVVGGTEDTNHGLCGAAAVLVQIYHPGRQSGTVAVGFCIKAGAVSNRRGYDAGAHHHHTVSTTTSQGSALALSKQGTSLSLQVHSVDDLQRLARLFAASGLFGRSANPDATLAQCAVQLLAGMEAGFTPFASITGIYVVQGRPGFSAQLLAQAIKKHPQYDYRVLEKTDRLCRIKFLSGTEELGTETFTIEMAERAGLIKNGGPWKHPEAMLFARALTAGMRTHCPDALGGHTPYTPEELGAKGTIDEQGMVTVAEVQASRPMLTSTEDLVAGAQRACDARGLTSGGLACFLDELGATCLQELERHQLARLAKSGLSPETVERCNAAAEALVTAVDEELPATWAEPLPAAVA